MHELVYKMYWMNNEQRIEADKVVREYLTEKAREINHGRDCYMNLMDLKEILGLSETKEPQPTHCYMHSSYNGDCWWCHKHEEKGGVRDL